MSNAKRPREGGDKPKKRYRSDGTPIWGKRAIDGPGIWVSCVKGKEKQTVGELYDLFESIASELWPVTAVAGTSDEESHGDLDGAAVDVEEDLEKQIAKELATIKRPRKEQTFANCQTNTPCVIFISCKAPVDPVELVLKHIENVEKTGITHTRCSDHQSNIFFPHLLVIFVHLIETNPWLSRYAHRLTPVSNTCAANVVEIKSLAQRILKPFLAQNPALDCLYKIELKVRNHNTLSRQTLLDTVVSCVPSTWTVDLEDAKIFILVEVFKSVCGIGIVKDYYAHQKFNVMEIANLKNLEAKLGEGRVMVASHDT